MLPESALRAHLDRIVTKLELSDDLKSQAVAILTADDKIASIQSQHDRLESELSRLNRMYQSGNCEDNYYDTEARRIRVELARLELPARKVDPQDAITALDDMARLWGSALPEEQAEIMSCIFERVNVDLDTRKVVGFVPKSEYASLFDGIFQRRTRRASNHRQT